MSRQLQSTDADILAHIIRAEKSPQRVVGQQLRAAARHTLQRNVAERLVVQQVESLLQKARVDFEAVHAVRVFSP